ncbi:MAG: two-component system OmpR family sensor kinase [Saprospiraceae bacterium]|jgi:two-component system OmpR family sensor kinase
MKIRHSLFAKLAFGLLALLLSIGLIYGVLSAIVAKNYNRQVSQDLHRSLADNLVQDKNLVKEGRLNEPALKETFRQYMVVNPSIEIYLLDLQGRIISYSADPGVVKRERVSLRPIFSFLDGSEQYPLGDDPRSHEKRKPFSVTEVPSEKNLEGYLYVVLRGEQQDQIEQMAQESYFLRFSGWAVFFSLLIGLLAGLLVFYFLTKRLRTFSEQIESFEKSGFTSELAPVKNAGNDEIDQINRTFESMAGRIRAQIGELEDKDAERRELVAQISHDLRTPLASMLGYLESLELKKTSLTAEQQQSFLSIAHKQGKRLSRMIEALFELSSLEAKETRPHLEVFAPAEWLYDVSQKHQMKAQQHDVAIMVEVQQDGFLAKADISLLERVMDNLIENALSHAKGAGVITLCLKSRDNLMEIDVTDQGAGISQEDLSSIFEPFVSSKGRTVSADQRHAGLGLAISKRIMTLLEGDIAVRSEVNKGTVFTLTLPSHN